MKLCFGDIVVVEGVNIGVVVKCWGASEHHPAHVEVYHRNKREILEYPITEVERYQVRHKELDGEDYEYQKNAEAQE